MDSNKNGEISSENRAVKKLTDLVVIDRLTVGPALVQSRRITSKYSISRDGTESSTELTYAYEEDVFTPGDPASENLANIITAQVAINYGLFCREIHFEGYFDSSDQQFIREFSENTAREIYVKKFLQPNPFLSADYQPLQLEKKENYLQSRIVFRNPIQNQARNWPVSRHKFCVLSSGGKDSLLSYGVLNEMGNEVHPIFGNESGRHWFTALNAYRFFKQNIPHTARVWMDSDRLFNWMLRHLPFIRDDFSQLRSDEYPIRLWTVAVFLFGVLPLMRKRGLGRLIVGDEFDTTTRINFQGITHYDGLFDQSRYFDQHLTRYFHHKGWEIQQFSILRTMSEFLIQKTLVERYPHLQAHQVSCHAAHKELERVKPCGKCEKCRRIVAMLVANGSDPGLCGYNQEQTDHCLKKFIEKGVHQEEAGVQHLRWLLSRSSNVSIPDQAGKNLKPRPEILALRFHKENSPVDAIPADLRKKLYQLLLQSASGAVIRSGRIWQAFDPLSRDALSRPYPFDRSQKIQPEKAGSGNLYAWGHLSWPEAKQKFREVDVALLPVGAIEQHGPHLPLDTDSFDAEYLAYAIAKACSRPQPLVLPLIPYGVSYHHDDFSGTISISNETLSRLVYEIGMSAARNGITKLIIVNGHGGNGPALNFAAQQINRDAHIFTCVDTGETSDTDIYSLIETPNDVHAGEIETSTSLALRPHLVRFQKAVKNVPKFSNRYLDFTSEHGLPWYAYTRKISSSGVMGDPTKATAEKGEKIWQLMIQHLVHFVEIIKPMTLDEIFQKRY